MSNLLPEKIQEQVWATTRARFIAVSAAILLTSAAFSAAAVLPSYLVLTVALPGAEVRAANTAIVKNTTTMAEIATTQALIKSLTPVLTASSSPDTRITAVVAAKPKSVHITHISYTIGKPSVLMVVGTSDDRDAINTYRAALLSANVGNVTIPVSTLVGSSDGQFTITISGDF